MRVKLPRYDLKKLFQLSFSERGDIKRFASRHSISVRVISDWSRGISSLPLKVFEDLLVTSGLLKSELSPKFLPDFWHIKSAARKGGLVRMSLYGELGTPEGRSKGGKRSIITHKKNLSRFKTLKPIRIPRRSDDLAEFIGLMIGDGHLSNYQASITTNSETDIAYARFTRKLFWRLFRVHASLKNRKGENTVTVVASSKRLVKLLNRIGMPIGNKIDNNLHVPDWIYQRPSYQKAFIRGLFDTDGCIYVDVHRIRNKIYRNLGWTVTSYADTLIVGIVDILRRLNFSPTYRNSQKSVYLRRRKEIDRYFKEISTHNLKHRNRYLVGCAEW